jgi:hypothetical protein
MQGANRVAEVSRRELHERGARKRGSEEQIELQKRGVSCELQGQGLASSEQRGREQRVARSRSGKQQVARSRSSERRAESEASSDERFKE